MATRPAAVVFDSNETLLDLAALDPAFREAFGAVAGDAASGASVRRIWFRQVQELFMTSIATGVYRPFDQLADVALDMTAQQLDMAAVPADGRSRIRRELPALPLHADVRPALDRLRGAGVRVAVLTNSTEKAIRAQMTANDLADSFERLLSIDPVERYKPAPEAYAYAARELDVRPGELLLVAAHSWDCAGAIAAGCRAAFVRRPGQGLDPKGPQPELDVKTLFALVDAVLGMP
ncbi:MAG TPA: haloacid dehalogenase type II [Gemmatirosa sp.]